MIEMKGFLVPQKPILLYLIFYIRTFYIEFYSNLNVYSHLPNSSSTFDPVYLSFLSHITPFLCLKK